MGWPRRAEIFRHSSFMFFLFLQVVVNDPDEGQNGEVVFDVNSPEFFVNETSGILFNTQPLDRETQTRYELTIRAKDKGTPPKVFEHGQENDDKNQNRPVLNSQSLLIKMTADSFYSLTLV